MQYAAREKDVVNLPLLAIQEAGLEQSESPLQYAKEAFNIFPDALCILAPATLILVGRHLEWGNEMPPLHERQQESSMRGQTYSSDSSLREQCDAVV